MMPKSSNKNKTCFFQTLLALLLIALFTHLIVDTFNLWMDLNHKIRIENEHFQKHEHELHNYEIDRYMSRYFGPRAEDFEEISYTEFENVSE